MCDPPTAYSRSAAVTGGRVDLRRGSVERYGLTDHDVAEIIAALSALGYTNVERQQRDFTRDTVTIILARQGTPPSGGGGEQ